MVSIVERTSIDAPIERCFYLSLNIDLHQDSTAQTQERAVAGVTTGFIGRGERVTWRGKHFGIMLHHRSEITVICCACSAAWTNDGSSGAATISK